MIIILSSPSGTGKSTLTSLLRKDENLHLGFSVSVTTRPMRPSEKNGVDYHFVDKAEFERLIAEGAFAEWALVHGDYKGTLRKAVDEVLANGQDIIFDIDYQGAEQMRKQYAKDIVSVFILPPSMEELQNRLFRRAEDSVEDMKLRLHNAAKEMRHWKSYEYIIVNENIETSFADLTAIITAERLRRKRQPQMAAFISVLIDEDKKLPIEQ